MRSAYLVKVLDLQPHPEGGFYREVYRSEGRMPAKLVSPDLSGDRHFATAIYFLLEQGNFSAFHRIRSDETWHFYEGDALEVLEISDEGTLHTTVLGKNIEQGELYQYTVKAGTWFGSRVRVGGSYALVGCTVSPGFDFRDFDMAGQQDLLEAYPHLAPVIIEMTRT